MKIKTISYCGTCNWFEIIRKSRVLFELNRFKFFLICGTSPYWIPTSPWKWRWKSCQGNIELGLSSLQWEGYTCILGGWLVNKLLIRSTVKFSKWYFWPYTGTSTIIFTVVNIKSKHSKYFGFYIWIFYFTFYRLYIALHHKEIVNIQVV